MKLAFSTLGCPDWDAPRVARVAAELGYDGVEIRGFRGRLDIEQMPEFGADRERTRALFRTAGLQICCLSTNVTLGMKDRAARRAQLESARWAIALARDWECPFVRVFGGRLPEGQSRADTADDIAQALAALGGTASAAGVTVLLETHDDFCLGRDAADVVDRVPGPGVGILWDILHPYRCGEALRDTLNFLGKHVRHVHVKDAVALSATGFRPVLLGEGAMPVRDAIRLLRQIGYDGYLSFEWEKKWHPDIPEPEVAIPHYLAKMREILGGP